MLSLQGLFTTSPFPQNSQKESIFSKPAQVGCFVTAGTTLLAIVFLPTAPAAILVSAVALNSLNSATQTPKEAERVSKQLDEEYAARRDGIIILGP